MIRYWPTPVCGVAVESHIKIKRFTDSADNASYECVRTVRVSQLIDYLGILNVTKGFRFTYGSIVGASVFGQEDRHHEDNNRQGTGG